MDANNIEKVDFVGLTQEVMRLIRKHSDVDSELEKDLLNLIKQIEDEELKQNKVRLLAYELASKLN